MKRIIASLLTFTMLFAYTPCNAFAEDFLTRGEACDIILQAADDYNPGVEKSDVMHGDGNGNLAEDREATKLEVFIMMNRAFGDYPEIKGGNKVMNIADAQYEDIPQWAESDMEQSVAVGIADSSDGINFGSNEKVTYADLYKYLRRVYAVFGTNLKDDYHNTVNKDYLDNLTIPSDSTDAGKQYEAVDKNEVRINEIINECLNGSFEEGTKESMIKNYYDNYVDMDARNALTFDFVNPYIEAVENMTTMDDFQTINENFYNEFDTGFIGFFDYCIDNMDSNSYLFTLGFSTGSVPQEACKGRNDTEKNAYIKYVKKILMLYGESEEQAEADANQYFETVKKIVEKSLEADDAYNVETTYNIYTPEELDEVFSQIDMVRLHDISPYSHLDKIIIFQVEEMKEMANLFTVERMDDLKNYCKVGLILYASKFMGEEHIAAFYDYVNEANGLSETYSVEEAALSVINSTFGDYIGEMYADKYCTEEIKEDVSNIVQQLIEIYRERIDNVSWMSDETKARAKRKLDTLSINIGEPDKYIDLYAGADVKSKEDGGNFLQNTIALNKQESKAESEISKKNVDKNRWPIDPQTVNASYSENLNGIYIPIAFLQEPIYSIDYSYEKKLGILGSVIGHEISHAFDTYGSQYDEYGNAVNWWTDEDAAQFEKLCNEIVDYYDNFEWCPGIPSYGEITLIENIADLGGMNAVLDLAQKTENFDYDEFFRAYSSYNANICTREAALYYSYADIHSPDWVRTNAVVQQIEKFYETYDIKEGDGMYVPEEDRIGIW